MIGFKDVEKLKNLKAHCAILVNDLHGNVTEFVFVRRLDCAPNVVIEFCGVLERLGEAWIGKSSIPETLDYETDEFTRQIEELSPRPAPNLNI